MSLLQGPEADGGVPEAPLRIAYHPRRALAALDDTRLLAVIHFGGAARGARPWEIGVPLRAHGDDVIEVWSSIHPVERGSIGELAYACDGSALIGAIRIDERPEDARLEAAAVEAYRAFGSALAATGYRSLCRVWNFFPAIATAESGLERYRAFCRGRHLALSEFLERFEPCLPAAAAIGTHGDTGLLVYGLALRQPGTQVENPRQMSAFNYPPEYGQRSPSFSRSILKVWNGVAHLYVSGTASIVGHSTRHPNDFDRQLDETLANLDALLVAAASRTGRRFSFSLLRVYSRPEPPLATLRARIAAHFGERTSVLVLQGDICRPDLMLEIEGVAISEG
jgi:Putative translation initiation inhibitor, yjgF family